MWFVRLKDIIMHAPLPPYTAEVDTIVLTKWQSLSNSILTLHNVLSNDSFWWNITVAEVDICG